MCVAPAHRLNSSQFSYHMMLDAGWLYPSETFPYRQLMIRCLVVFLPSLEIQFRN